MKFTSSILAALLFYGCSASDTAARTLRVEGKIDAPMVNYILKEIYNKKIKRIIITSAGGDSREAMRLGYAIRSAGIKIEVQNYCNSACAQYVFTSSKNPKVNARSVVLFHGSMKLKSHLFYKYMPHSSIAGFGKVEIDEEHFYKSMGANTQFSNISSNSLGIVCVRENLKFDIDNPNRYELASIYSGFALQKSDIEDLFNIKVDGFWPSDQNDLNHTISNLPFSSDFKIKFNTSIQQKPSIIYFNLLNELSYCEF